MLLTSPASWNVRGATFLLWLLAAGSAAYWTMRLGEAGAAAVPVAPPARPVAAVDPSAIARLLGGGAALPGAPAVAAAPALASRFNLVGVAAGVSGGGAALISVDGKPARPYRVGAFIEEGLLLQAVQGRIALIGRDRGGPPLATLELPPLQRPTPNAAPR